MSDITTTRPAIRNNIDAATPFASPDHRQRRPAIARFQFRVSNRSIAALGSVALMTLATAGPALAASGAEQFCADNGDFGISHGQCVSQAEANNGNADVVAFCRILELDFGRGLVRVRDTRGLVDLCVVSTDALLSTS